MIVWDHLLASVCGIGLPLLGLLQHRTSRAAEPVVFTPHEKVVTYWASSVQLTIIGVLTLLVWKLGGRSLHALGLTAAPEDPGTGIAIAAVFLVLYFADLLNKLRPSQLPRTHERWRRDTPFMPTTGREVAHSLPMVAAASVWEEVVFRGFLIAYVSSFTGGAPLGLAVAVVLPAVVFGALHLYQGVRSMLVIVVLAGSFGAIFVVTGSLWIPMVLHFLVDLIGVLLGPRLMRDVPPVSGPATGRGD